MMADAYRKGLPIALERGRVTIEEIDACVRRVLRLKEQLGLFDDPYRRGATPETAAVVAERRALARDVGAQGHRHAEERARHPALACGGEGAVRHRPAGRRKHRDERPVVGRRRTRAGRQRARRPARRAAADRHTPCTRRRHRGRRRQRHRSRRRAVRRRRRRPAVPGRACHDERRGGEPRHARASRATAGAGRSGDRPVRARSASRSSRSCSRAARSSFPGWPNTPMRCWPRGSSASKPATRSPTWSRAGSRPAAARR